MSIFRSRSLAGKYKQDAAKCQAGTPFSSPVEESGRSIPAPVLVGAGLLLAGASYVLGTMAYAWIATHPPRFPVVKIDKHDDPAWEDVTFPARDGLRIAGWFAPAKTAQGGVILCHGHPMNRVEMLPWARLLHHAGFHVLLFDFRAMGQSEGSLCSIGYHEVQDLLGATDYLCERPEMRDLPLGAYGISMGGAVTLMAAAQEPRLAAVATHGAYASLDRAIDQRGRAFLGPAGAVLSRPITYWGKRWLDKDPQTVSPCELIAQIAPRPVLLMHGARDIIVNPADAQSLYDAASEPKTLTVWPRSWHVRINAQERLDYEAALVAFFQTNLH
jgi:alpha-beta hydrolase superfamily lysophospholipase